ncbi:Uncharacterised protein [Klebsiella pneumoniae]|nr:Uncharacterised protein [Klebsiella pneumoniae]
MEGKDSGKMVLMCMERCLVNCIWAFSVNRWSPARN